MEEILLENIKKKILDTILDFYGGQSDVNEIINMIKEYGEYKYDAGAEQANLDSYYSGDEA